MTKITGDLQLDKEALSSQREEHGSGPGLRERVVRSRHSQQSSMGGAQRHSRTWGEVRWRREQAGLCRVSQLESGGKHQQSPRMWVS